MALALVLGQHEGAYKSASVAPVNPFHWIDNRFHPGILEKLGIDSGASLCKFMDANLSTPELAGKMGSQVKKIAQNVEREMHAPPQQQQQKNDSDGEGKDEGKGQ